MATKQKDPNKVGLFDWVGAVSWHKQKIINPENERSYDPFMVTRSLAMTPEFLPVADMVNSFDITDKYMHFEMLRHVLEKPRRKPFSKFVKKEKPDEDLILVSDYFQCTHEVARTYMSRIGEDDIERFRLELYPSEGGKGKLERIKQR